MVVTELYAGGAVTTTTNHGEFIAEFYSTKKKLY